MTTERISIPAGVTFLSHVDPPAVEGLLVGDLWNPAGTTRLFRLLLAGTCPTCKRPGRETWSEVPGGMATLELPESGNAVLGILIGLAVGVVLWTLFAHIAVALHDAFGGVL